MSVCSALALCVRTALPHTRLRAALQAAAAPAAAEKAAGVASHSGPGGAVEPPTILPMLSWDVAEKGAYRHIHGAAKVSLPIIVVLVVAMGGYRRLKKNTVSARSGRTVPHGRLSASLPSIAQHRAASHSASATGAAAGGCEHGSTPICPR